MLENKRFIAYLDDNTEIGSGRALFYISDVDNWNHTNKPSSEIYNDSVYNAIEKLCKYCRQIGLNHFEVYRPIENTLELKDFLKSISWIKVIDEDETFINPEDITSMRDNEKDALSVIKRIERRYPKKVIVDETIVSEEKENDLQLETEFAFVNYAREKGLPQTQVYEDFTSEKKHINEIKEFVDKSLQNAKIVFCLPINKEKLSLFAFDEQKQIDEVKRGCEAYQKLISEDFDKSALEDFDLE